MDRRSTRCDQKSLIKPIAQVAKIDAANMTSSKSSNYHKRLAVLNIHCICTCIDTGVSTLSLIILDIMIY